MTFTGLCSSTGWWFQACFCFRPLGTGLMIPTVTYSYRSGSTTSLGVSNKPPISLPYELQSYFFDFMAFSCHFLAFAWAFHGMNGISRFHGLGDQPALPGGFSHRTISGGQEMVAAIPEVQKYYKKQNNAAGQRLLQTDDP